MATDGRDYEGPGAGGEAEPSPGLSAFGYQQSLHRRLRSLSLHALTFSSLGVLLSSVLLIGPYWAAARGGAIWAYVAGALICQTSIALVFAELAAEYPVSGSVFNWIKKLAPAPLKWMSGWLFTCSGLVGISAGGLALATLLPRISPVFQLVGTGAGTYDFSENAVLLGSATMLFAGAVNVVGVRFLGRTNQVGASVEIATIVVAVVALLAHAALQPAGRTGVLAGFVLGLSALARSVSTGFLGLAALWLVRRNGLRSAAVAGLQVVAVPHPRYPPDPDALALARAVLPSLPGLTPDLVAGLA